MRVFEELRGTWASLSVAANRSSVGKFLSRAISLSRWRRPEYFLAILRRRLFFSMELFFAISVSWVSASEEEFKSASLPEREVEGREQGPGLVVVARGRADDDVHAPHLRDLVVVDLGKHDVLADADA